MQKLVVGYAGLSKASWKTPKIQNIMDQAVNSLKSIPIELVYNNELSISEKEIIKLCGKFDSNRLI